MNESITPALYLFPVPMGDAAPADVLPRRNLELLRGVRHFVVENVRSARRFLRAACPEIVIDDLSFTELSEHTPREAVEDMLGPLEHGEAIGVISEAGCPAVADPGADIVAVAQRRGLPVVPLVGPSSILLSLMASGFNGQTFTFRGYLPIDRGPRNAAIRDIERAARAGHTQIFIETPYRNNRLVDELVRTLPADLRLCVASDIGGSRENITTLTISQWRSRKYDYAKIPTIFLTCR
jgi:16S rRNA (cytidine1402-2'-O)-methyltransferase